MYPQAHAPCIENFMQDPLTSSFFFHAFQQCLKQMNCFTLTKVKCLFDG